MAQVIFYEKPGCVNNTRQKKLLESAGHQVIAKNLLTENWNAERLQAFFNNYSISEWFNRAAPKVKSGEVIPEQMSAEQAIAMMITDPLLIRRPLMQVGKEYRIGFDQHHIAAWIGLSPFEKTEDLETCTREQKPCPDSN
jgi:nitrogenase-associated protein